AIAFGCEAGWSGLLGRRQPSASGPLPPSCAAGRCRRRGIAVGPGFFGNDSTDELVERRAVERFALKQLGGDLLQLLPMGRQSVPGIGVRAVEHSLYFLINHARG